MAHISRAIIDSVLILHKNGVRLREIARRMELAPATVFRIIHGQKTHKVYKRCPECGALLKGKNCRYCEMRKCFVPLLTTDGNSELKLELRPAEYERYLVVRKQAEERIERMLRNREVYEERLRVEDDRGRRTKNHKKVDKKGLVRS